LLRRMTRPHSRDAVVIDEATRCREWFATAQPNTTITFQGKAFCTCSKGGHLLEDTPPLFSASCPFSCMLPSSPPRIHHSALHPPDMGKRSVRAVAEMFQALGRSGGAAPRTSYDNTNLVHAHDDETHHVETHRLNPFGVKAQIVRSPEPHELCQGLPVFAQLAVSEPGDDEKQGLGLGLGQGQGLGLGQVEQVAGTIVGVELRAPLLDARGMYHWDPCTRIQVMRLVCGRVYAFSMWACVCVCVCV
jgi:hypothetical protein